MPDSLDHNLAKREKFFNEASEHHPPPLLPWLFPMQKKAGNQGGEFTGNYVPHLLICKGAAHVIMDHRVVGE